MRLLSSRARQEHEADERRSQQERLAEIADEMKRAAEEIEEIVSEIREAEHFDVERRGQQEGGGARDV